MDNIDDCSCLKEFQIAAKHNILKVEEFYKVFTKRQNMDAKVFLGRKFEILFVKFYNVLHYV